MLEVRSRRIRRYMLLTCLGLDVTFADMRIDAGIVMLGFATAGSIALMVDLRLGHLLKDSLHHPISRRIGVCDGFGMADQCASPPRRPS